MDSRDSAALPASRLRLYYSFALATIAALALAGHWIVDRAIVHVEQETTQVEGLHALRASTDSLLRWADAAAIADESHRSRFISSFAETQSQWQATSEALYQQIDSTLRSLDRAGLIEKRERVRQADAAFNQRLHEWQRDTLARDDLDSLQRAKATALALDSVADELLRAQSDLAIELAGLSEANLDRRRHIGWMILALLLSILAFQSRFVFYPALAAVTEQNLGLNLANSSLREEIRTRAQVETALKEARVEAERLNDIKSEFLANMSHEIRTPLNGIIGMAGLLKETRLDEEQQEYSETISTSGEALLTIIGDILDFSKIEAGRLVLEEIDFDLCGLIKDAVDLFASHAEQKQVELTYLIHCGVPGALRGDPGRLRQVLVNLISNAIKFTEDGEIALSVRAVETEGVKVRLLFEVQDSGIGIPLEKQAQLFSSFSQADTSTTRKYGGTGLGLAISKRLVKMMGGDIAVSSEVGTGSRFQFEGDFIQRAEQKRPAAERAELDGKRALLVEAPSATRANLQASLNEWGMMTCCCESAEGCLEQLRRAAHAGQPIDLAILDYRLLGESAMALATKIRRDQRFSATRLVIMTSIGRRGEARRAQDAGVDSYLTKPVHPPRLFDCLRLVLARKAEAQPNPHQPQPLITVHSSREEQFRSAPKVLVVEDNVINQRLAVRLVEKMGYRVDVAANGLEAVEAAGSKRYQAILMDCQMPELDGFQATQRIRSEEDPASARVPIIALTANALSGVRAKCLAAGMDDFLTKPVRPDALAATLERWVAQSGAVNRAGVPVC